MTGPPAGIEAFGMPVHCFDQQAMEVTKQR